MWIDESIIWDVIMHNQNKLNEEESLQLAKIIKDNAQYFIAEKENSILEDK